MNTSRSPTQATPHTSDQKAFGSSASHSTPRVIDSAELFLGQSLLQIRHLGEVYRLQTTRQGKLLLTK